MANVAHASLTGADLHEPKGIDTASADEIYIADGAGSGNWTPGVIFNPFGSGLLHVRNQQTSGIDGASLTNGAWRTRVLNTTVTNEISGASLGSNQVTLPEGDYHIEAFCTHQTASTSLADVSSKLRLRNITGGTTLLVSLNGQGFYNSGGGPSAFKAATILALRGRFSTVGTVVVEIQDYPVINGTEGTAISSGEVEVYADVMFWKVG